MVEKAWRPGKLSVHGNTSVRLFLLILVGQAGKQQARAGRLQLTGAVHSRQLGLVFKNSAKEAENPVFKPMSLCGTF